MEQMKLKDIDGEFIELKEPKKLKRLIYHKSLTHLYTKCPYCGAENPDEPALWPFVKKRVVPENYCSHCFTRFDGENLDIRLSEQLKALYWYREDKPEREDLRGGISEEVIKEVMKAWKKHKEAENGRKEG